MLCAEAPRGRREERSPPRDLKEADGEAQPGKVRPCLPLLPPVLRPPPHSSLLPFFLPSQLLPSTFRASFLSLQDNFEFLYTC